MAQESPPKGRKATPHGVPVEVEMHESSLFKDPENQGHTNKQLAMYKRLGYEIEDEGFRYKLRIPQDQYLKRVNELQRQAHEKSNRVTVKEEDERRAGRDVDREYLQRLSMSPRDILLDESAGRRGADAFDRHEQAARAMPTEMLDRLQDAQVSGAEFADG